MTIEAIVPSPRHPGRFTLRLEHGASLAVTEEEVLAFGLCVGLELDDDTLLALRDAIFAGYARRKAAELLALRPMSRVELTRKLAKRGILPENAEAAADDMTRFGFLNDAEYAKQVAEHYAQKGYGPRRVQDELYKRGVARGDWPDAPAEPDETAAAIDAFLQRKLRGRTPDKDERRRLAAALQRRGFGWSDIAAALRRLGEDVPDFDD